MWKRNYENMMGKREMHCLDPAGDVFKSNTHDVHTHEDTHNFTQTKTAFRCGISYQIPVCCLLSLPCFIPLDAVALVFVCHRQAVALSSPEHRLNKYNWTNRLRNDPEGFSIHLPCQQCCIRNVSFTWCSFHKHYLLFVKYATQTKAMFQMKNNFRGDLQ